MASKSSNKLPQSNSSSRAWVKQQEEWFAANPDRRYRWSVPSDPELDALIFSGVIIWVSAHSPNALPPGCKYVPGGRLGTSAFPPLLLVRRATDSQKLSAILFPFFPKATIERGSVLDELMGEKVWSATRASLQPGYRAPKGLVRAVAASVAASFMPAPGENVH